MKALLFDMDGTLADTEPLHLDALRHMLREHGVDPDMSDFHSRIAGRTSDAVAAVFFPDAPPADLRARVNAKEQRFRDLAANIAPAPGLLDLLDRAARDEIKTGLVTNAPMENVRFMLAVLGLEGRFDTIVVAADLPRAKPDPLPYLTALDKLSVRADEALAFEDSLPGIRSATGAGLRCIGISTSLTPAALLAGGAFRVMANFTGFSLSAAA
ncbi:HAD family phosphatase [Asticcacaulis sp. EMRT-3]|uniref:HAD family hydrolase n=1 Tax=Asticcacaulis sp. EMRT-3 TaxID=3040349 RepID=UPI0024AF2DDC|nr:HAD family phosphatase [Asticcacaulis sp. EMRT-3]MDI7775753.1 HAD family phosphatase [Asticcacaulis sp. EMRT-3]